MHPLIDPVGNYEPSREAKNLWRSTRKKKIQIENLILPGLYQTYGYKGDVTAVIVVIILELIGIGLLSTVISNSWLSLLFLGFDLALAFAAHLKHGDYVEAINKIFLAKRGVILDEGVAPEGEIEKQEKVIRLDKIIKTISFALIIIFALVKIFAVLRYTAALPIIIKSFIILIYAATAYIHIRHTGYMIAEFNLRRRLKKERKKVDRVEVAFLARTNVENAIVRYRDELILDDHCKPVIINKQEIKRREDGKMALFSWGLLQDDELIQLVNHQETPDLRRSLATKLLRYQVDMLAWNAAGLRGNGRNEN